MKTYKFLITAVFLSLGGLAHAQTVMKFGNGAGEVTVPDHYEKVEDKNASLVIASKPGGKVRLYLDMQKLDSAKDSRPAEALIRERAAAKKKGILAEGDKVSFFDPQPPSKIEGKSVIQLHWHVGFGNTLVVISAHIPQEARNTPEVEKFLSDDIDAIMDSLHGMDI